MRVRPWAWAVHAEPIGSYAGGYRGTLRLYGRLRAQSTPGGGGDDARPRHAGRNRPETTIGAFGVAAVGTLPVQQRWRFSGRLGLLSMDGRAESRTTRTAQGMLGLGVGFTMGDEG